MLRVYCCAGVNSKPYQSMFHRKSETEKFSKKPSIFLAQYLFNHLVTEAEQFRKSKWLSKADTVPAPQGTAMGLKSDLGTSAAFPRAQRTGKTALSLSSCLPLSPAPKGASPRNNFTHQRSSGMTRPRKRRAMDSAAEGRTGGAVFQGE